MFNKEGRIEILKSELSYEDEGDVVLESLAIRQKIAHFILN